MTTLPNHPSSLCILRLSAIGDCCHAIALVQTIQRHWPNTKITWVIGKVEAQLIAAIPNLEDIELIVFDKKQGRKAYQQLKSDLKGRSFDVLYTCKQTFEPTLSVVVFLLKNASALVLNEHVSCSGYSPILKRLSLQVST